MLYHRILVCTSHCLVNAALEPGVDLSILRNVQGKYCMTIMEVHTCVTVITRAAQQ